MAETYNVDAIKVAVVAALTTEGTGGIDTDGFWATIRVSLDEANAVAEEVIGTLREGDEDGS